MERRTKYLLLILSTILVGCSGMRQVATRNQPLDSAALLQMTSHSWDQEGRADFLFPEFSKLKESLTNPFDNTGSDNNLAFKMSIGMDQGINQEGNVSVEETPEVLTTTQQNTATEQTTEIQVETAVERQIAETTTESVVELSGELTSLEETVGTSEQASNVTQEEELYEWMYVLECEEETSEGWITETIPVQEKCANGTSIEDIIQNAANSDSNLILDLGNETNESCIAQPLPAGETTEEVTEVEVTETCTNGTSIEAAISNMTVNDDLTLVTDEGDNTTCLNQPSFPEETAEEVTEEEMTETCSNKTSIEEVIGNMTTNDDLTLVTGEESPACENQQPSPEETVEEITEEETAETCSNKTSIEEVIGNMTTNDDLTLVTNEESPVCENQSPPPEETIEEEETETCSKKTSIEEVIGNMTTNDDLTLVTNEENPACENQSPPPEETVEEITEEETAETCSNKTSIEEVIGNMTTNDDLTLVTGEESPACENQSPPPEEIAEEVTEEETAETCSNKTSIEEVIGNMTTNDDLTLVTGEESPACENQSPPPEETVEETTEEETPEEVAEEATETIEEVVENEYPVTSENVTCLNDQPPQPVVETIVEEVTVCCTNESSIEFVIQEMFANDDLTLVTEAQSGLVGPVGLESRELVSNLTCRNDQPYRPLEIMEEVTEVCIEEETEVTIEEEQAEEEAEEQLEEATEEIPPTEEIVEVEEETPVIIPEPEVEEEEAEATTEAEENQEQVEEEAVSEGETCNQYGNSIEEIIDNMYSDSNLRLVTGENETCGESQPVPPEQSEEETTEITQPTVPQEEETAEETIVIKEEEEETPEEVIPYVEEEVTEETTEIIPPIEETVEVIEEAPEIIPQPEIEAGEISEETIVTEEAEVAEQIVPYLPVEEVTEETTERIPLTEETVEVVEETVEVVEETPVIIPPIEEVVEVVEETSEITPQPEIEAGEISEETIVIEEETAEIIVPYLPVEEAIEETIEIIPPTEETVEVIEETTEIIPPTEETVEVIEETPEVILPVEEVVEVVEETSEIILQPEVEVEEESTEETTEIILPVEETEETVEKSCFDQDITMKPYDENYVPAQDATTYTDSTLTLREKIIFANALKSEDHETIELLENPASTALKFNKADLTSLGLTITDDDNYAYSLEMPWNGTFSLTYFVPINKISNNVQPIFSTNQFVVTASYNDPYITYTVSTETDTVLTFTIENQSPDYDWWSTLSSEEKAGIFDNYIGQKVDLLFSGHDCWLSVTGVNDVHETSDTWSCLQPNVLQNSEVDVQDSKIRDHFGRFKLGFDGLVNQTVGDITVSNVYLIGTLRQLHIFRANLTVGETSNGFTSESCEIGWDWGKLSTLPPTVDSICSLRKYIKACQLANLSSYGPIGVIDLSHAFKYLPEYVECGNVGDSSEGQSVRTHICSNYEIYAESQSIEYTTLKANSSLTFFDLIALSSDSDRANLAVDILGAAKHGKLYLVAEKFSRLRSVIPANFPIRKVNDVDFKFTMNILSYANEVLNADGSTILIKVGLKLRLFTSNTIDISFMIGRDATQGTGYLVSKSVGGSVKSDLTINSVTDSFTYGGTVFFDWGEGSVTGEIEDGMLTNEDTLAQSLCATFSDRPSSEIEVALETAVCYGPDHRCFKPEYIVDRYSVLQITDFELNIHSSDD